MAIINIKFRNTTLSLESDNENRIIELSEKLNKRAELISHNPNNTTDTKLAVITALMLEDQLDALNSKFGSSNVDQTKAAFIETITQLTEYLEYLADSIEKR